MAARRLLPPAKKKLLPSTFYLYPKLPSLALFSTFSRKGEHFYFTPRAHRPPTAKKVPFTATEHGLTWQDPYHWMSDISDPDFISYINQENAYAEAFMRDTEEMQRTLYSEMVSRMPSKIITPPERWGPWLYYQFIPEGKEYPILCRKSAVEPKGWANTLSSFFTGRFGTDQVLLDWNEIAEEHVVLHTNLGSHSGDDAIIFAENDPRFCVDITSTKDGEFVTVYVISATNPKSGLQRFCKRVSGVQYFLEHHFGYFYVLTNAPTSNNKKFSGNGYYVARCIDENVQATNLKNVIMPGEDICLEDMDIYHKHLVLFVNIKGSPSMCSINMPIDLNCEKEMEIDDLDPWYFPLPSNMCAIMPGSNHDFKNTIYRAVLSSPVTPDLLVDYDMSRKIFSVVQQDDVRNISASDVENKTNVQHNVGRVWKDFSEKYACEEKEVVSRDGVKIPMTIVFSRSEYRKGLSPGLLHGYGAYGEVLDKSWCPDRSSLLDRGWMFAFADVRGGAGADPSWHESGRGLSKLNSIYDFLSCGEYLINEGFIHKNRLGALGTSAGCLLVGAAVNMNPELFHAAIFKVPFLDVLNTLLDPTLPLTTLDYEEFGNPQIKSCFEYIRKYSPYDNIPQGGCCPPMLVSASFHDARVGVWEAAKWVAKMRDTTCSQCSSGVILRTNMNGGHFREGGRYMHCWETAYDYAFLMKVMEGPERMNYSTCII
ncbi:hypothetical protein OROHE_002055 [Orobanche hederae]